MEKYTFQPNKKRIAVAELYYHFYRRQYLLPVKAVMIVGVSALMFLVLLLGLKVEEPLISALVKLFIFIGLVGFGIFQFFLYLNGFNQPDDKKGFSQNIFEDLDLGAVHFLRGLNFENPDLEKIFDRLFKSRRVQFILTKLDIDSARISELQPDSKWGQAEFFSIIDTAYKTAKKNKSGFIDAADIFWGFMKINPNLDSLLIELGIKEEDVEGVIFWANSVFQSIENPISATKKLRLAQKGIGQDWASGYTLFLDQFSFDMTGKGFRSFSGVGREKVIAQIENVLTKGTKSNCLIVGPVGSGKSTLIEVLASKIAYGDIMPSLSYKRLVKLDVSAILAAAKSRAELEQVVSGIFDDAVRAGNIILYIDDIDLVFSGGQREGTADITSVIGPYLENSDLKIIGATTQSNYETYLVTKPAISSNFTKVDLEPTNEFETLQVLTDVSLYYETKNNLSINFEALKEIYRLSEKFIVGKEFPGRAIDLLENVSTAAKNKGVRIIDKNTIDELAEVALNVPVTEVKTEEKDVLINLEQKIHGRVIGQEEAVVAVSDALRRARTQVSDNSTRPVGTFLFLGPTGVGKTELAKSLAWAYFGNEEKMIRMDMNEFQDAAALDRFIGRKISGREELEGGDFVKKVREDPFSVVLLDEIEKANKNILDLFLQMLDEGYMTDGMGEKVSFRNAIIIGTSNADANLIREGVASGKDYETLKTEVFEDLQKQGIYKPEFLNRFDGVILFRPLTQENLMQIAGLMFKSLDDSFESKGFKISLGEGVLENLAKEGYQPELGARPMRRVFQDRLESYLAKKILEGSIQKGKPYVVQLSEIYTNLSTGKNPPVQVS